MRVLALIPARAGSKGLPHKNVRKVGGVPLLVRAIHLAQRAARLAARTAAKHTTVDPSLGVVTDRRGPLSWTIAVSTEDARYAKLARAAGADVITRPASLATDEAQLIDVVTHALTIIPCDVLILLSAMTPLTRARDICSALALWAETGVAIASVTRDTPPPLRFALDARGHLLATVSLPPGRRQESPDHFRLNGAIYVATPEWIRRHGRFVVSGSTRALPMAPHRGIDIDSPSELRMARTLLKRRNQAHRHAKK